MIDWLATIMLVGVFFIGLCRLHQLDPHNYKLSVSIFYLSLTLGCGFGAMARVASLTQWPEWAAYGEVLPMIGLLIALLTGTERWKHGAPDWAKK